jgi:hypothetical protein
VYHPFPDSNAVWNVKLQDWNYEENFSYVYSGDTLINGFYYHKITKPFIYRAGSNMSNQFNYPGYYGCLRQDTINKKVYAIQPDSATEIILYDFNLQIGDTLKGFAELFCPFFIKTIISIDSILIGSSYRKWWNTNQSELSLIEGIGSTLGLIDFCFYTVSPSNILICYEEADQILYPDTNSICNIITSINKTTESRIFIFPNPAHDRINIECKMQNAELKIYDITGRIVMEENLHSQLSTVNCQLSSGVYFVRVSDGKQIAMQKLIIE